MYKCTEFVPIANISEVRSNELTPPPSYMCLFVGGCTVKQAMYRCHHRLVDVQRSAIVRCADFLFHACEPLTSKYNISEYLNCYKTVQVNFTALVLWQLWRYCVRYVRVSLFFICPIAIAYSYGTDNKISLPLSVCVSVCLSVCHHSHGRVSLSIFTKFDTEV